MLTIMKQTWIFDTFTIKNGLCFKKGREINGNSGGQGLAMHHYVKESDRGGIEFDKNQFCTQQPRVCVSKEKTLCHWRWPIKWNIF